MHELSLAQSVVEILQEEGERHGLERIERIRLRVGALRAVVPELLQTSMGFAAVGTLAEGAEVIIEEVPGRARCPACALEYPITELLFICPGCGQLGGEVLGGEELSVVEIEGEERSR